MASLLDNFFNPFGFTEAAGQGLSILSGNQQSFDYQKELNDKMMEREDNAYQRAVVDAKKAGLSPLSVNGGASANSMTSARIDNSGTLGAALGFATQVGNLKIAAKRAKDEGDLIQSQIDKNEAETGLTGKKAEYQDVVNAFASAKEQLSLDEISAQIAKVKTESWSIVEGNERAEKDLASLIGVRDSQIKEMDARTRDLTETLVHKISNMDADTALNTAHELESISRKSLIDIQTASETEKFNWLKDLMQKQLDLTDAQIKNLDHQNAGIIMKAITGLIGAVCSVGALAL